MILYRQRDVAHLLRVSMQGEVGAVLPVIASPMNVCVGRTARFTSANGAADVVDSYTHIRRANDQWGACFCLI